MELRSWPQGASNESPWGAKLLIEQIWWCQLLQLLCRRSVGSIPWAPLALLCLPSLPQQHWAPRLLISSWNQRSTRWALISLTAFYVLVDVKQDWPYSWQIYRTGIDRIINVDFSARGTIWHTFVALHSWSCETCYLAHTFAAWTCQRPTERCGSTVSGVAFAFQAEQNLSILLVVAGLTRCVTWLS